MPKIQLDTRDQQIGQDSTLDLSDAGILERPDLTIQPADGPIGKSHMDDLAFMEEKVDVMVAESTSENAENPVFTAVNGVSQYFYRGQVQTVRRKYLEVLARAKEMNVRTPFNHMQGGADPVNYIQKTYALKYPFSVVRDDNPRGRDWLKRVLADA